MNSSFFDVAIVGAGAAGIGAARRAQELALSFALLEAMPRIGGRAFTDPRPFGVPWDAGCHWLHSASLNPFRDWADQYGFRYRSEPSPWRPYLGGEPLEDAKRAALDDFLDRSHAATVAAGTEGRDVPAAFVVDTASPWFGFFAKQMNAEWGVAPEAVSTLDAARYDVTDTDEDWPVQDGYGALVARHAAGIPVELATPVERIEWGGRPLRIVTSSGVVEAGTVVVTVSTNVLADDVIAFGPPLPDWKREAAAAVPLGSANKVGLAIDGNRLGVEGYTSVWMASRDDPNTGLSFQLRPFGWDLANAYLSGPEGAEMERAGEEAMVDYAVAALRQVVGNDVARHVRGAASSRWGSESFIRGAYAAARPGQGHQREALRRPIDDRLFFAGEATAARFFSTCHGAYLSGIAAIEEVALLRVP